MQNQQEFYRYQNERGVTVIVDSLSRVPEAARARAERVSLSGEPSLRTEDEPLTVDWPSFGAGFGTALVLAMVLMTFRRFSSPLARLVLFAIGGLLASSVYLGWLRRTTGQSEQAFGAPSALIDDARRAVEALKKRNQHQAEQIDEALNAR